MIVVDRKIAEYVSKSVKPILMAGPCAICRDILNYIEENYQDIDYLGYDIEYFGWEGESADNIHKLRKELITSVQLLYAICKTALSEEIIAGETK